MNPHIRPGLKIPEFGRGKGKANFFSFSAHNLIVRAINALLASRITRGDSDKFLVSDHNATFQLGGGDGLGGGGGGSEIEITSCVTGKTYVVFGHEKSEE